MTASPLVPCPSCDRHVRAAEARCPFCDGELPVLDLSRAMAMPAPGQRLGRAATFVFGATLGLAGCGDGGTMALYGAPAVDGAMAQDGTAADDGGSMALYGGPSDGSVDRDASMDDAPADNGGTLPLYGAAPSDGG